MSRSSKILMMIAPVLAIALAPFASAAERTAIDRMVACSDQADDAQRLACYDREIAGVKQRASSAAKAQKEVAAVPPSSASAATTAAPKPAVPAAAPVSAEDSFGVHGSEIARQRKKEEEQRPEKTGVDSISAKVTAVSTRPRGELVIALDNGQTWTQKKTENYFPLKAGDAVTINAGMLGSFRLVAGNRSTQVTRIK